mmetsp:Transcript_7700/g.10083  ORF Transcript_7700/g.10083 Transcript_7700/m.10083 type:complete len:457 (-) Transcript_7700:37-1407(-)
MVSTLHARKRFLSADLEAEAAQYGSTSHLNKPQQSSPKQHQHYLQNLKRFRNAKGPSDILIALLSVCGFLAMGLLLGFFLLHHQHRKVIVHLMRDPVGHGAGIMRGRQGFRHHFYTGHPRFVAVVMPSVVNAVGRSQRLNSIQDTWGGSARAIFVVHNVSEFPQAAHAVISDNTSPEDRYAYPQLLLIPPEIENDAGVGRLIHTIREIHEKVDPDFAFFVNDHTFVIPAHLCKYLEDRTPTEDMYEGHALRNSKEVFNSGAAGYVLSRSTMEKLVDRFDAKDPNCGFSDKASGWLQKNPGLVTQQCMASLGIHAVDTRSANKWHRFHAYPLTRVVSGDVDEWYIKKHKDMDTIAGFDPSYNELRKGEDCCSWDTISFHYVEQKEAKALFAVQESLLEHPHLSNHEVKLLIEAQWPSKPQEIGYYSAGLPKDRDAEGWKELIATIRKISTRGTQRDC